MRQTFITKMPDESGAFLVASKIISTAGANITRVSYNKAIDMHTLIIDVSGEMSQLSEISEQLENVGYLLRNDTTDKVILLEFKLRDIPGVLEPVLELISHYNFNISYINSEENGTPYQYFKMGLFLDEANDIKEFLSAASKLCEIRIIDYDNSEKALDDTVFYLSFASGIANRLKLSLDDTNTLIAHSELLMQLLEDENIPPHNAFRHIDKYADVLYKHKGASFHAEVTHKKLPNGVKLHIIEPPCGSNSYIFQSGKELLFIDSGFACYRDELMLLFSAMFPDFATAKKDIIITHTDIGHCGLLDLFGKIFVTKKSYDNFVLEYNEQPGFREQIAEYTPYCKITKIISGYKPPKPSQLNRLQGSEPNGTEALYKIDSIDFHGIVLDIYRASDGHSAGGVVIVCESERLVFSGDIFVDSSRLSAAQQEFNAIAPFLKTSANMDNNAFFAEREALLFSFPADKYTYCCGHGSVDFK